MLTVFSESLLENEDLPGIDSVTFVETEEENVAEMIRLGLDYTFVLEE